MVDQAPFEGRDPAFFSSADGEWFVGYDSARGPWNPEACHGGPPAGLLARAAERELEEHRLTRLTVDLTRPVPLAGFSVTAEVVRAGRTVATSRATLVDGEGRTCATAHGLHVVGADIGPVATVADTGPDLAEMVPGEFPISSAGRPRGFASAAVDVGYPPDETRAPGPTTLWMRTIPLLEGEDPSPFQRVCPLADCGNGLSRNSEPWEMSFVNADLTITLHRDPEGEWLASSAVSHWEPTGIGLADAVLYDAEGAVGRACQVVIVRPA